MTSELPRNLLNCRSLMHPAALKSSTTLTTTSTDPVQGRQALPARSAARLHLHLYLRLFCLHRHRVVLPPTPPRAVLVRGDKGADTAQAATPGVARAALLAAAVPRMELPRRHERRRGDVGEEGQDEED